MSEAYDVMHATIHKIWSRSLALTFLLIVAAGCATQPHTIAYDPPGFLSGLVHGLVVPFVERKEETLRKGWPEVPDWVFCSETGTSRHKSDFERRVFHKLLAKAGLRRVRFHDFRHTFASRLLQNGESLVYVKDQMGPGANRAAVNRLDDDSQPRPSATLPQPIPRKREQG